MVAAVAALEPQVAANSVQAPILECMMPPGSHDSQWIMAPYIRSASPERNRISPNMTNNGMLMSRKPLLDVQATSPMARESGSVE